MIQLHEEYVVDEAGNRKAVLNTNFRMESSYRIT